MKTDQANRKITYGNLVTGVLSILLCLVLVSFWMLGNLYARYATQASGGDDARVARFAINASDDLRETYVLNPSMTAGNDQTVEVQVENSGETAVRYTFSFETEGNLPLNIAAKAPEDITLQKDADENRWSVERAAGDSGEAYDFILSMADTEDNYQYAGEVKSVRLTVTAEQID